MTRHQALWALLLNFLAALGILPGAAIIFFTNGKNRLLLSVSLGFAAGMMIGIATMDLFPHALSLFAGRFDARLSALLAVGCCALGMAFALALDVFLPSGPAEILANAAKRKDMLHVGLVSMLAIALHNVPEGIATFTAGLGDHTLGVSVAVAIALLNLPEGIVVAMPIYFATKSRAKALLHTLGAAMGEPAGALLTLLVLRPFISDAVLGAAFAAVAGVMIYLPIEQLIPASRQYDFDRAALFATLAGFCIMPLTHAL